MRIKKLRGKRGQEEKISLRNFPKLTSKRGQEEMVGFALIIIIVAVILLVFLAISLNKNKKEELGNTEVNSFVQSFLSYTTNCREDQDSYYSIQELIKECEKYDNTCLDGRKTCEVLNSTLKEITDAGWKIGESRPIKGYELFITVYEHPLIAFQEGNITRNYKGSPQSFPNSIKIIFTAYY